MALPGILQLKPLAIPKHIEEGSLSIYAYREQKLPFNIQEQQQANWCWAAVTISVNHFFNAGSVWTQCSLASTTFTPNDCCANGGSAACNQGSVTSDALQRLGNHESSQFNPAPFQTIMDEINGDRPLACRMTWRGGGAHAITIYGFAQADYDGLFDQWVFIKDPGVGVGASKYLYNKAKTDYMGVGDWTKSSLTKS